MNESIEHRLNDTPSFIEKEDAAAMLAETDDLSKILESKPTMDFEEFVKNLDQTINKKIIKSINLMEDKIRMRVQVEFMS